MASDDVIVKFGGSLDGLTNAVEGAKTTIESLAAPFTGLTSAFGGLAEAFAAAFAVDKIKSFAESMAELGTQTGRASQILGVSTEEVGGLSLIAKATGGSIEELQVAFSRLSKNIIDQSDPAKRALAALGLTFADIRNLTPIQQLELLATKFQGIKDGGDKDAIAIALLGRAGENLIPLLNKGAAGIQYWVDQAKELGVALSKETVEAMEEMHAQLVKLGAALLGEGIQAFVSFKGAISGVVQLVTDLAVGFRNAGSEGGAANAAVELLSTTMKGLAAELIVTTGIIKEMWAAFSFGAEAAGMWLSEIMTQVVNLGHALRTLDFSGVKDEWSFFKDEISKRTEEYTKDIDSANADMFKELQAIWQTGDKKIEAEHAQHQARMAAAASGGKSDNDALNAQMKEIDGELKAAQEGLALKKTVWDGEVAAHRLSKDQEIQLVIQATNQEYQAQLALLQKEKSLGGLKQTQIQEINNKIEQLQAKHNQAMIQLDQQVIAEETAAWQRYADIVTSSFNSLLRGLITGTTNFKTEMKNILTDILMKFVEVIENMVVKWAVGQLAMTTATVTGAQARTAAELAGQNASNAGALASILRTISASAGETFAGVFGFLAPVLGPAAAGPAAASEATVLSVGAGLASFASGAWNLPGDMIAKVHAGEMIIPAGPAAAVRDLANGAGLGNTVHVHHATNINVSTLDGRSTKQFFNDHARTILRAINESVRTGAHLGLSKL